MKIVLNGCYGGFGLSYEAMYLYLTAKNKEVFFYADISTYDDYTKVHKYQHMTLREIRKAKTSRYIYCTTQYQGEYIYNKFPEDVVSFNNIDRTDPTLVSVVETIGPEAASGRFASLYIEELPAGTLYKIDKYDGLESLITMDDDDWLMADENECSSDIKNHINNIWSLIKPSSTPDPYLTFKY